MRPKGREEPFFVTTYMYKDERGGGDVVPSHMILLCSTSVQRRNNKTQSSSLQVHGSLDDRTLHFRICIYDVRPTIPTIFILHQYILPNPLIIELIIFGQNVYQDIINIPLEVKFASLHASKVFFSDSKRYNMTKMYFYCNNRIVS